ncbi:tetratricopeptide repeat protein [Nocardiopsis sp. ATB16-24]|uniref:tetratricopeptide repeat protein n=1 Tax=Nocardiopsis sp. ATB16-24 TaxID=3019555 RepID=UPI002557876C|nr:tetratricopeptide repeat protein [Nocardiopsis sp. ATB16-24]
MTQPPPAPSADRVTQLVRHLVTPDRDAAVLLTAHPGPHWTLELAAALWELPLPEAQHRLKRLVQSELLICHDDERHTMATAVRAALERTGATVLLPGCRHARRRMVAHYTEHAIAADLVLDPGRWRWHPPMAEQVRLTMCDRFTSPAQALRWFRNEQDNLLAVVELAHRTSHHQQVVLMAEAVNTWDERQRPRGIRRLFELGLASAEAVDDGGAQAVMHHAMASQHLRRGEHESALASANYALALWSSEDPRRSHPYHGRGLAHFHLLLSQAYEQVNDLLMAARYADLAVRISEAPGHPRDRALARYRQALALSVDERWAEAAALLRSALPPLIKGGERVWTALVHRTLCEVLMDLGQYEAAHQHGHTALDLASQEEVPVVRGQVHESLAWLAHKQDDLDQARDHFEWAWASYTPVDPQRAVRMLSSSREFTRPTA